MFAIALGLNGVALAQAAQQEEAPAHGKVLFNRDQDSAPDNKKTGSAAKSSIAALTDEERSSLTFTAYDLDVHLAPSKSRIAVHARFTVKNIGTKPLPKIALQISSSLHWESFAEQSADHSAPLTFAENAVATDADHTGRAQEATVVLPQPLAPGEKVELAAFYSGEIQQSGERLEHIGAPVEQAALADWDKITPGLTALRGFGNVLWYPTAAAPVFLGDGAKLFQGVGKNKLQQSAATVRLRLTVEYAGEAPDAAYFCGRREPLVAVSENSNAPVAESPGIATAQFPEQVLGFRTPSLFVTDRAATTTDGGLITAVTDHYDTLPNYAAAAAKVQPLLKDWFGAAPLSTLNMIDVDGQPFEDDALLVTQMHASAPAALAAPMAHSLTHVWFDSSHVWLDEGVAQFVSLLWTEGSEGREAALSQLQQQINTLALAEPAFGEDGSSAQPGESLIDASDEVYFRTKAAAVLWMLRSMTSDDALKHALQAYRHDRKLDSDPEGFEKALEQSSHKNLRWFFDDWVYRDRGLPDLSISSVTPRQLQGKADKEGSWLIAVEVRNDGDAAVEVPVTIRSGTLTTTEQLRVAGRSSASTRIVFGGTPEEVLVNDGSVPEMRAAVHRKLVVSH
jgi:hypothetical protein